jgi:hypothetical protein
MGYRVGLVTGEITDDRERELLRNRFRLPKENEEAIDILLSSEVGCEGWIMSFVIAWSITIFLEPNAD